MPKKKIKKIRGSRTCGGGSHKKRRGRGSRGGAGNAGILKHKYLKAIKEGYEIGKHGFRRPENIKLEYRLKKDLFETLRELKDDGKLDDYAYLYLKSRPELNVGDLNNIIEKLNELGLAEKEEDAFSIDLSTIGYYKLLGRGIVNKKMKVKVEYATPKAVEKIEAVGGAVVTE
ncbi:LSU ribosomal protein L15P [Archaeoglobus sulfaticallidus PM70-1]|uniref:Large ribosomal subunit protein uL15 n=1 Tax=Archaeoglobus sulfaticallidus PM70-1 TaxID=387631 RepID=N0BD24_9EURY|nr:uL15m family ribosomal protein [Archaeoglobus sulfaticallidus]AGK60142.1 LSU ribosomal protein L15P [Archaeoglobus sulfaticallidus PM70-1]